jgi:hypothetical protein
MNEAVRQKIRRQSNYRCEYCRIYERHLPFASFHLDHIVASQHRGTDDESNLAWSCHECNLHKGPNLTSIDPDSGKVVLLFSPRRDQWDDHFEWEGDFIRGKTESGRATVWLLQMNSSERLELRAALRAAGDSRI